MEEGEAPNHTTRGRQRSQVARSNLSGRITLSSIPAQQLLSSQLCLFGFVRFSDLFLDGLQLLRQFIEQFLEELFAIDPK
jgi:hypothetical protein